MSIHLTFQAIKNLFDLNNDYFDNIIYLCEWQKYEKYNIFLRGMNSFHNAIIYALYLH